ncbi:LytTR family transcriptional regulator DNA-binding domain-containing protein [Spirosoma horti]
MGLKQAEEKLPIDQFLRISRSHIINIQRIVGRQGEELLIDKKRLRVGRTYKQYVNERLRQSTIGLV